MQTLLQHKIVLIMIALAIAGAVWYGLSPTPVVPDLTSTPSGDSSTTAADQGIVATLLTLRAVKLDGTIFSDPKFTGLKDFSTEIVAELVGRTNPFAPLSSQTQSLSTSTKSTQTFTPATH